MGEINVWMRLCVVSVASVLCFVGCDSGGATAANDGTATAAAPVVEDESTMALRQRATEFGNLLVKLSGMTAEEGHYELQFFVAPSPQLRDQVMNYYQEFSAKSKMATILSQSVADVRVHDSGTGGDVTYGMVARFPDGRELAAEQDTAWQLIDGQWYRSISAPVKRLR